MRRKREYKKINLGFPTQKEYERFHREAVKEWGDGRNADCNYLRMCIDACRKRRTKAEKEKAIALVETTQKLNDLLVATADPHIKQEVAGILKEMRALWVF